MEKETILQSVYRMLSSMGISYEKSAGTDISIDTVFLDAAFSTGNKKIRYESQVFLDEEKRTAFMWEKTTETGMGFSFGSGSESGFQSGKTLFRKVKSIQYAPDGKAYEYTLDLGAIPRAVRDAAKANGWRFRTVLRRGKAQYPAGHIP